MKQWSVVYTQARKELFAKEQLLRQRYEVYLPMFKKQRQHARQIQTVCSPLFPRYVFVGIEASKQSWRSVQGTRGVCHLVMQDELPAMVSGEVISHFKSMQDDQGFVPLRSLHLFLKGEPVQITDGAFSGQMAVFEALDDKERVQLLLNFMGRDLKVTLPLYAVRAA